MTAQPSNTGINTGTSSGTNSGTNSGTSAEGRSEATAQTSLGNGVQTSEPPADVPPSSPAKVEAPAKGLRLPKPDRENITVLLHNLPKDPVLPWNHYDSPWEGEGSPEEVAPPEEVADATGRSEPLQPSSPVDPVDPIGSPEDPANPADSSNLGDLGDLNHSPDPANATDPTAQAAAIEAQVNAAPRAEARTEGESRLGAGVNAEVSSGLDSGLNSGPNTQTDLEFGLASTLEPTVARSPEIQADHNPEASLGTNSPQQAPESSGIPLKMGSDTPQSGLDADRGHNLGTTQGTDRGTEATAKLNTALAGDNPNEEPLLPERPNPSPDLARFLATIDPEALADAADSHPVNPHPAPDPASPASDSAPSATSPPVSTPLPADPQDDDLLAQLG